MKETRHIFGIRRKSVETGNPGFRSFEDANIENNVPVLDSFVVPTLDDFDV